MARKVADPEVVARSARAYAVVQEVRWIATFVLCVVAVGVGAAFAVPQVVMVTAVASVPSGILTGRAVARRGPDRGARPRSSRRIAVVAAVLVAVLVGVVWAARFSSVWLAVAIAVVAFVCEAAIGFETTRSGSPKPRDR